MAKKSFQNLGANLGKTKKKVLDTTLAESVLDDVNLNEVIDLKDDPEPKIQTPKKVTQSKTKNMDSKSATIVEETKKTSLYFPKSIHKMVKQYCLDHEITMTDYLVELITRDQKKSA